MAWLRLIRWPNLLIIALTQFVAWWCVILPLPGQTFAPILLGPGNFFLLCTSTVLIAAAGYIINDYFDIRIDAINKPQDVILEKTIPRRMAIIVHSALNLLALCLAGLVAIRGGHPEWLVVQIACTALLWRYSTTWKRQFIIGNVVVALLTAFTVGVLIVYEPGLHAPSSAGSPRRPAPQPLWVLVIFMCFAFALTWMREIVKDMEDYKGDDAEGCVTMPIQWGLLKSTRFVQALGILVALVLAGTALMLWLRESEVSLTAIYIFIALLIPLAGWIVALPGAASASHYHRASTRLKWIMVSGIVSLLVMHLTHYG